MDYLCAYCKEECPSSDHCVSQRFEQYFCTPECHRAYLRSLSQRAEQSPSIARDARTEDGALETLYGRAVIAAPAARLLASNNVKGKGQLREAWLPAARAVLTRHDYDVAAQFDARAAQSQRRRNAATDPLKQRFI